MLIRTGRSLVLRYNPGQFTFRQFAANASNHSLYQLAVGLNAFQEDNATQVLRVEEFELAG